MIKSDKILGVLLVKNHFNIFFFIFRHGIAKGAVHRYRLRFDSGDCSDCILGQNKDHFSLVDVCETHLEPRNKQNVYIIDNDSDANSIAEKSFKKEIQAKLLLEIEVYTCIHIYIYNYIKSVFVSKSLVRNIEQSV